MTRAEIEARYCDRLGTVPEIVQQRITLAEATGRLEALAAMEAFREAALAGNPLDPKLQRLVHFGMTLAISEPEAVAAHAATAKAAGASLAELMGVCETAAIVFGMPAYTRGVRALSALTR